ncbi:MAG: response regulator [Oscillospiraceae bacterium]|nr:response regulator [Oscillospiraceae bacterium]
MEKLVFIVDDNETNLAAGAAALEDEYKVHTMTSAKKMFDLMELFNEIPDLILLDVEMPEMNGLNAIVELKKREKWQYIPVVFLTGWADEGLKFDAEGLGADAVIGKPFDPAALLECVRKYIEV